MIPPSVRIRQLVPSDVGFVLKTWMREHRRSISPALPDRLFYQDFQKVVLALTRKSYARVACPTAEPNYILGFALGEAFDAASTFVCHYAYVRGAYRRLGVATAMCEDMGYKPGEHELVATHWSEAAEKVWAGQKFNMIYNPYIIYGILEAPHASTI